MIGKTLKYGAQSFLSIALMFVILAIVNILLNRAGWRRQFDLTEEKVHTIPEASLNVVRNLKDIINVTIYKSETENLPPVLQSADRQLRDKMAVYADAAGRNLTIEYVDPAKNEEKNSKNIMNPLMMKGIRPIDVTVLEEGSRVTKRIYISMEVQYGDKSQIVQPLFAIGLASAQLIPDFEYQFTAALKKVTQRREYRIGFATNRSGLDLDKDYGLVMDELRKQYDVETVKIEAGKPIQSGLDVLAIVSPGKFSEGELYQIDQFVMRGGRLVALVDLIDVDFKTGQAKFRETNLTELLAHYGVRVDKDMALDQRYNSMNYFTSGRGGVGQILKYPQWIRAPILNQKSPIVNRLPYLAFTWASTLKVEDKTTGGATVMPLAYSSPSTWVETGALDLNPNTPPPQSKDAYTSHVMAAAVTGQLTSYFAARPPSQELTTGPQAIDLSKMIGETQTPAQAFVVGDADFLSNQLLSYDVPLAGRQFAGNYALLANVADWMTIGEDLIGIRSRGHTLRPLDANLSDATKARAQYANTLLVPSLVFVAGLIILGVRRHNRRRLAEVYSVGK